MGLRDARRRALRGSRAVARSVTTYQAASVMLSLEMAPAILDEQGIDTTAVATVNASSLLTDHAATTGMLDKTTTDLAFDGLVLSLIQDAARTASSVANATRPSVTGYVRYLTAPSCSRCAILAGRVYRYSQGFQRHPRCDCVMTPTNHAVGPGLVSNPMKAFRDGQIRGMSKGDIAAINDGADLGQVVNVRRKAAGLLEGSSVMVRAGRMTPQLIYRVASDRTEALSLLRRNGYIT